MKKISIAAKALAKNIRLRLSAKRFDADSYEVLNERWHLLFFMPKYYLCDGVIYYGHPLFWFTYSLVNEHYKIWLEQKKESHYKIKNKQILYLFIGHSIKFSFSEALALWANSINKPTAYTANFTFLSVFKLIEKQLLEEENYELLAILRDEIQAYQEFEADKKKVEK